MNLSSLTSSRETSRLLLLSCSQQKRPDAGRLPALERYDGPCFRALRSYLRRSTERLQIRILSARFGLIRPTQSIPYYDQRLTAQRTHELEVQTQARLKHALAGMISASGTQEMPQTLLCMGRDYLQVIARVYPAIVASPRTQIITGSPGQRLAVLHDWLYGAASPLRRSATAPDARPGSARLRGVEIKLTTEQVMDIARAALASGRGEAQNFHSWYALVDAQRVAPKWLVSQLTDLPVSAFATDEARRVLRSLGIEVARV